MAASKPHEEKQARLGESRGCDCNAISNRCDQSGVKRGVEQRVLNEGALIVLRMKAPSGNKRGAGKEEEKGGLGGKSYYVCTFGRGRSGPEKRRSNSRYGSFRPCFFSPSALFALSLFALALFALTLFALGSFRS